MNDDDAELAATLGLLPEAEAAPKCEPPAYAGFDPRVVIDLPPRERLAAYRGVVDQLTAEFTAYKNKLRAEYERDMESLWRVASSKGKRKFVLSTAEAELPDAAKEKVTVAKAKIEAYRTGYDSAQTRLAALIREAADAIVIPPAETGWYYKDFYPSAYNTQTHPQRYAEVAAMLAATDVRAAGVGADVKFHDAENGPPFYAVYAYCAEADLPILRLKSGVRDSERVRLAWKFGVNPRVYWPLLPPGYEEAHGFDYFGNPTAKPAAQISDPTPDPTPEPEII